MKIIIPQKKKDHQERKKEKNRKKRKGAKDLSVVARGDEVLDGDYVLVVKMPQKLNLAQNTPRKTTQEKRGEKPSSRRKR